MFTVTLDNGDSFTAYRIDFDHYENKAYIQLDQFGDNELIVPCGSVDTIEW